MVELERKTRGVSSRRRGVGFMDGDEGFVGSTEMERMA